jgi:DNA repair protein RadC
METSKIYQVAEIELVYKSSSDMTTRTVIRKSQDAYKMLMQSWEQDKMELLEQFSVLLLNRGGKVLGVYHASSGGTSGTIVDIKLIMTAALKTNAAKLILAHNHPSGTLRPSEADRVITSKIVTAGKLLDISVDDHIILTPTSYFSFADEGIM